MMREMASPTHSRPQQMLLHACPFTLPLDPPSESHTWHGSPIHGLMNRTASRLRWQFGKVAHGLRGHMMDHSECHPDPTKQRWRTQAGKSEMYPIRARLYRQGKSERRAPALHRARLDWVLPDHIATIGRLILPKSEPKTLLLRRR